MDYATMLVFLLECGKTLRIMQRCSFRGFRREQTRFKDRPQVLPDETRSLGLGDKDTRFECSFKPMLIPYGWSILAKQSDPDWSPYDFT
ncbi:hypothetical protein GmHk_19G054279 [Glycine max]|nr:hypothetical protein GmHk_19G054279 [Glycine max]